MHASTINNDTSLPYFFISFEMSWQARPNPPEEWVIEDVPELRIVSDELWNAVKKRQAEMRRELEAENRAMSAGG